MDSQQARGDADPSAGTGHGSERHSEARPLYGLTVQAAHRQLKAGEISAVELAESVLDRIEAVDATIRAFITITADTALHQARRADERRQQGEEGPLLGVPMAVKDLIATEGIRTTAGSRILESFVPPYNATVIDRLYTSGAVLVGKTNLDEFAMGSSTENSAFFDTRNPWDVSRVPGGSSGGSAAAVAADATLFALGTDTGGSVRQPAALCGVVGLKPTYGRVSRYGLIAYASSLDQIGPLTKTVTDAGLVLNAIAGHDRRDATSVSRETEDFTARLHADLSGVRLALPREYFGPGIEPGIRSAVRSALDALQGLGAVVEEVTLPHTDYALSAYYLIAPAEASANLARYDGVKYGLSVPGEDMWGGFRQTRGEGFGPEVKRRIMLGAYALSAGYYDAYYKKAQQTRTLIRQDFEAVFEDYDVVVVPTSPTTAFELGSRIDDPLQMYLSDTLTLSANLAGLPGISVPCGFADGLPVGLQFIGQPFDEAALLQVAYQYEQVDGWHTQRPDL